VIFGQERLKMSPIDRQGIPTIGVLAGWQFYRTATNLSYLKPIFSGINRAAQDLGCNLLLGCGMGASASPADPIRPAWPIPAPDVDFVPISPLNTHGLIVFNPLHSAARSRYVQDLIRSGHPVLFIGAGEHGPSIVADNVSGIFEAVGHLVQHGHQRIAFLAGSPDDMEGDTGDRLRAYQAALVHYGLEWDPRITVYGRHVFDGGYSTMHQLLNDGAAFTAVLASNDEMALGAMQALKEAGRSIPQDVAVIGFDNRLEGATQEPALSSVHVPLFHMGYRAVELLLQQMEGKAQPRDTVKVNTRLVMRESCGCGRLKSLPVVIRAAPETPCPDLAAQRAQWVQTITTTVLNQAQSLAENECRALCQRLVDGFSAGIEQSDCSGFHQTLNEALRRTVAGDDDAHIWQDAITLLKEGWDTAPVLLVQETLDQARQMISAQMQRQHRSQVVDQRWSNSRLSLLTAGLQTALDEKSIYEILAQHLPEMKIPLAMIVLFEADGNAPAEWSTLRQGTAPEEDPIRFPSQEFPPAGLFARTRPYQLALVPLVDQTGQLGFVVFGTEYFDLYGSIVQQLGGAFNTARLYRQATEGRRLAEEANRMKSRFLSTISHELRTPLNLIVGLSGMILRDSDESETPLPEAARKDVDRIRAYSQHLGGLIGDVIDLATSDAGQLRLNHQFIDLGLTYRMVAESGGQLAADKGLVWEARIPETGPWVWGDQTRLRQVALNLINNAIKFTTTGGVSLRLEETPGFVTVTVRDTGLGISPSEQRVIFDEFRQSERSVARGYGGLGLGLAICKRLVEMHGGSISVHSSGEEGAGSAFSFTLPTVPPPLEKAPRPETLPAEKQCVVVLTDNPGSSARLREHLHQRGFSVQILQLKRGMNWRGPLEEAHSDTIILDVSSDAALSWETLKEIKSSQGMAGIPVLLYSASQQEGSLLELDYLTKPIEISELTRALDQQWLMADTIRPSRIILVVDDEPHTLEMHARIVQSHSSSNLVLRAHNGKEALEILHREIVDLILLDLQMPEMDGFEVLEVMRGMESTRKIPVIVVTGKDLTEADMARLNQGVTTVLGKGLFSIEETIGHISAALEHKRRLSGEAQRLVRFAMAYLHENYAEAISRRDIAQHIGITEDHLTFCFRQELGTTPIEYLQRYRINQAKRLLKERQQTITEIALNVGFSDSGYFSRIFRRETGMSPEVFRRSS
jgi:signal transduction histidine kinase/DNA-binding LacI/PurR family transcriptional regulator/AraC-like DNA-binding protein